MLNRPYQILSTLYYLHVYYIQNSHYDKFNFKQIETNSPLENLSLQTADIWIITKLQHLITNVTTLIDNCRFHEACRLIEDFIIGSLSQTYVPSIRHDLWDDSLENKGRRFTIYSVLYLCLKYVDILLHPYSPFLTEYLYLTSFKNYDSLLFENWPDSKSLLQVSNNKVESAFDQVKAISSLSFSLRNKSKLKRRWPLESAYVYCKHVDFVNIDGISDILKEQMNVESLNVMEFKFNTVAEKVLKLLEVKAPISIQISINKKNVAKKVRSDIPIVIDAFSAVDKITILREISRTGYFPFSYSKEKSFILEESDLDITYKPIEQFLLGEIDDVLLFVSTIRNPKLIIKGMVRDLSRNLQQLRKELGFNPTEILQCAYISNVSKDELNQLSNFVDDIKSLVRVKNVDLSQEIKKDINYKTIDIDGKEIMISVV
ncbi:MAG: class I tRNA ligase family protein [Thermoproteota archaeon]|nr:class I tRNA ligase family protein [Thermoproteota archaeon]